MNDNESNVVELGTKEKVDPTVKNIHVEHITRSREMLKEALDMDILGFTLVAFTAEGVPILMDSAGNPSHVSYMTDVGKAMSLSRDWSDSE